jgi:GNAT superfamily N-acetyltransferase
MTDITITMHDGPSAAQLHDAIVALYGRAWAERVDVNDFYRPDRFAERFTRYTQNPGFALSLATDANGQPIGMMFGAVLAAGSHWWDDLQADVPDDFTVEDGNRTFGVNELAVTPARRREGIAGRLHDALIDSQPVRRAALLVRPDNQAARRAYARWGWQETGTLQPSPDMPDYIVMIRQLRDQA